MARTTRRSRPIARPLPISVVIPTLDAARWIRECLESLEAQSPSEIIVVDGGSEDGTLELLRDFDVRIVHHAGIGPAAARLTGGRRVLEPWVAFIDADIVLPDGALAAMLDEVKARDLSGLQARFVSEAGPDYWSRQVARHHNRAPSRAWFGLSATLLATPLIDQVPFDEHLASGEDVDFRRRLRAAGIRVGIAASTVVRHRYAPGFEAVRRQWLDDGAGLGRLVRKEGFACVPLAMLPFAAAALGLARSPLDLFRSVPYYVGHGIGNGVGLVEGLLDRRVALGRRGAPAVAVTFGLLWLLAIAALALPVALLAYVATHLGAFARLLVALPVVGLLTVVAVIAAVAIELRRAAPATAPVANWIRSAYFVLIGGVLLIAALRLAALLGILP